MMSVPLVAVTNCLAVRENGFAAVEKPGLLASQETEEGTRPRRTGCILFSLDIEHRVEKVVQFEYSFRPVSDGFEEPGVPCNVSVVARAAITLRQACRPEPFADLRGLTGIG